MKRNATWIQAGLGLAACAGVWWLEHRRTLRADQVEPKERRVARNLAIAGATALVTQLAEQPLVRPISAAVDARRWGVVPALRLPGWLETALAVILMDYTLYVWHILVHRVPWLWRSHAVHHIDLELDASTAIRFHFTEFLVSIPYRAAQVLIIGVGPKALKLWQVLTGLSVVFHHSNIRLPFEVERVLSRLVVTPRLHGIHHSIVPEETDSNFSSGLTIWDFLHGTVRMNVRQDEITIGIPAYREPTEVTLPRMMSLPFGEQRDRNRLPGDGIPARPASDVPRTQLLP
jgi:sterol desaturase/sphingolipid hydroxylase (fatty acid hydroxylase superfamily)